MNTQQYMEQLETLDIRMSSLTYTSALMGWDSMTLASKKGVDARSSVIGNMSELFFTSLINDEVKEMLDYLTEHKSELDETIAAKVRLYLKDYNEIMKIPKDEYAAYQALISKSNLAWEEAREKNDFSIFAPYLDQVLKAKKKFVKYRGYEGHPYNTLLDDYEDGLTVEAADEFFSNLKAKIVPLVKRIQAKEAPKNAFLDLTYDISKQKEYSKYMMEVLNFRMDCGCLAESAHPFTMNLSREDVRITTKFYEKDLLSSISSTIHETGHALYEQNISPDFGVSILTSGTSMGIHESQSRLYENNFGRSLPFWHKHYGRLQDLYPEQLGNISVEDFQKSLNTVKPSLIRIDADEVTYPLHVMVRYEMEKMIMSDDVNVDELPRLWNDKYEEYLGVRPETDSDGILQDVHWSEGLFGYFPSYALGSAYASQFEFYMRKDIDVDALLASGDMAPILKWLSEKIHVYGSSKIPSEIIEGATGEKFNPKYFVDYLETKYSAIYDL